MDIKIKALFVTNLPSPYKVEFLNLLAKSVDLRVVYERKGATNRNEKWFVDNSRNFEEIYLQRGAIGEEESFSFELVRYIKTIEHDRIVIMNGYIYPSEIFAINYMKRHHHPFFIMCDGMLPTDDRLKTKIKSLLKRHVLSKSNHWLSSGKATTAELIKHGATVDGIIEYPFSSISEKKLVNEIYDKKHFKEIIGCSSEKMLLYVGQIIPRKGIDLLLEASKKYSDITFYVIGGKLDSDGYDNIINIDFMTHDDLASYYKAADALVLPTNEDIWGLVVNEAMAVGTPVITTDRCGAGLELVQEGKNGFLFHRGDVGGLVDAIQKLYSSNEITFENINSTAKKYTIENMSDAVYEALKQI